MNEQKETEEYERFTTSSNQLAAFLVAHNFSFRPLKVKEAIKFEITGIGVFEAVKKFYQNENVPVQSYLSAFERLRATIVIERVKKQGE